MATTSSGLSGSHVNTAGTDDPFYYHTPMARAFWITDISFEKGSKEYFRYLGYTIPVRVELGSTERARRLDSQRNPTARWVVMTMHEYLPSLMVDLQRTFELADPVIGTKAWINGMCKGEEVTKQNLVVVLRVL